MRTTTLTPRRARKILRLASDLVRITTPLADDAGRRLMGNDNGLRWWRPGDPDDKEAHQDWMRLVLYSDTCDEIAKEVSRMNIPVKDDVTIPWMSTREIPAIKFVLQAWRKARKDSGFRLAVKKNMPAEDVLMDTLASHADFVSHCLEEVAIANETLKGRGKVK